MPKFRITAEFEAPNNGGTIADLMKAFFAGMKVDAKIGDPLPVEVTDTVIVYVDGGCHNGDAYGKKGLGAWAFVADVPGRAQPFEMCEAAWETTNNKMELTAVLRALENLEIGPPVLVVSDSEYVIKGCTSWGKNWIKNGWKTNTGTAVKNRELWEPLLQLVDMHEVKFKHVKGHSGVDGNERVDALCTLAMQQAIEAKHG